MGNNEPKGIPLNKTLFPEHLQSQGYQTHLVGKWAYSNQTFWSIFKHCDTFRWHVGFCKEEYLPQSRGFHSAFGYWGGGIVSFHPKFLVSFVMNFHWLGLLQQNQGEFARFSLEPRCILWQQRIFHGLVQYQDSRDHCWSWPKRPFVYLCCNANTSFSFTSSSGQYISKSMISIMNYTFSHDCRNTLICIQRIWKKTADHFWVSIVL